MSLRSISKNKMVNNIYKNQSKNLVKANMNLSILLNNNFIKPKKEKKNEKSN